MGNLSPGEQMSAYRAIDAAENRAREALRVLEDVARFALNDRHITEQCKVIRHQLNAAVSIVPGEYRIRARDTQGDVGTGLKTQREASRQRIEDIVAANVSRAEESLRSLEEWLKLLSGECAAAVKQLRYRVYTLSRCLRLSLSNAFRFADARVYVLIDGRESLPQFRQLCESLVEAGAGVLQLRDKQLSDRDLVERARAMCEIARGSRTACVVNDRPDLAALSGAAGVHVGQDELSVADARRILGPGGIVGVSTHSIEQARQAVLDGADYIGVGPTFPSGTKRFDAFPGLPLLRAVAAEISLPAFAIGGITEENLDAVLECGIVRVAVSQAVVGAAVPAEAVRRFNERLSAADARRRQVAGEQLEHPTWGVQQQR